MDEDYLGHSLLPSGSAAGAGVGEERHLAGVLHGTGDEALLLDGDAGDAAGTDLSALGDELAKGRDVFVVDDADADRLRGSGVLATLTAEGLRRSPLLFPAIFFCFQ
ncbi:hypothetical protein GCM10025867_09030 [Frondihabitans sucicola]|uniref:Uncharacterized protein n=1 Tax=Frondihabitans sucicola TaxID=1268041 RepID=A0ABM8GJT9_9MICO|nr:hypothetical protein GCM10025867_09030 [Frondihabitans sucicola]